MRYYKLTIYGTVSFSDEDKDIEELLLGLAGGERFELAIQELEEEASQVGVTMELVEEVL